MSWTTARDLKVQVSRLWDRGELLRQVISNETAFPLRLTLKGPSAVEVTDQFQSVRSWMTDLMTMPHVRIEWRDVNHRVLGSQRLPQSIWIESLDEALTLVSRCRDAQRFAHVVTLTRTGQPALVPWLAKHPLRAIELVEQWPKLLAVVEWLKKRPRPGIYLRQVDIPGIQSKFIGVHRAVLLELLDLVLPPEAVIAERKGFSQFCPRYGFLDKPTRTRFRVLDERINLLPGPTLPDVTLDADSFASLDFPARRVFITENETNFLAFPPVADSIVIFGAGYGWDALARASWLTRCTVQYWGDIDTHGFAILDQLRSRFQHVGSFLMDRDTLMAHEVLWGEERDQIVHDLSRLTEVEGALFDELRDNRIRKGLRLEQELVGFEWATEALKRL